MAVVAEAGIPGVGENRAQDLQAKHGVFGDTFRWHFIGRLQSNKVKIVNGTCELVHSLDSHSAAERLEVPALLQVNLAGEGSKGGVVPDEVADYLRYGIGGLSTMPPGTGAPEESRPWFRRLRELADAHGLDRLSMGTTQDYRVAAEEDEDFYADDEVFTAEESLEQTYRERPNVRRLTPRRRSSGFDDWTDSEE